MRLPLSHRVILVAWLSSGGCAAPSGVPRGVTDPGSVEPHPLEYHLAAQSRAAVLVPDPARGGPPPLRDASPLPPFLGVSRATGRYVGTVACAACHPAEAAAHTKTAHAHARDTLTTASAAANPACLACHVTGFGHPGGWTGAASAAGLDAVGCEACHGPGSDHIAGPSPGYGALPGDAAACVACHTHDASPDFRYAERWPRVAHGAGAAGVGAAYGY